MLAPTIYIKRLTFFYNKNLLFNEFNLTIRANRLTCLLGGSGVGKSTLLKMIAGIVSQQSGKIHDSDEKIIHDKVAYMAQQDLLMPWLSVLDNVLLGYQLRKGKTSIQIAQAKQLLYRVGLADQADAKPHELSGGMRQRAALARTLIEDKPIVLMDEPFNSLDVITRQQLHHLTCELLQHKTVLLVTHDPIEAVRIADDIYVLKGNPVEHCPMKNLSGEKPRELTQEKVLGCYTRLIELMH